MKTMIFRAFIVAAVAAPILILINQYQAIFGDEELDILKVILTCLTPFVVSLVSQILWGRPSAGDTQK